jgi:acetyl esterase
MQVVVPCGPEGRLPCSSAPGADRPELDAVLADLLARQARTGEPAIADCAPAEARALARARCATRPALPPLDIGPVEEAVLPGPHGPVPARIYYPSGAPVAAIVYLHGGGWVTGDLETADGVARILTEASGCIVINVDYRLAPEHPFPIPLDDAFAAVAWAGGQFGLPVFVAGDSAGANLAAACALRAGETGAPSLAGQLLFCPATDHDFGTGSHQKYGAGGYGLTTRDMRWFWQHYAGPRRSHRHASPLRAATLPCLPPAFVAIAGFDPLRDEGIAYANRLRSSGVPLALRYFPSMIHGFVLLIGIVPHAEQVIRDAGRWIQDLIVRR